MSFATAAPRNQNQTTIKMTMIPQNESRLTNKNARLIIMKERNNKNDNWSNLSSSRRHVALVREIERKTETLEHQQSKDALELALQQRLGLQQDAFLSCDRSHDDALFGSSEMTVDDNGSSGVMSSASCPAIRCGMRDPRQRRSRSERLSKQVSSKEQHDSRVGCAAIGKKLIDRVPTNMKESIFGRAVASQHEKRCKRRTVRNSSSSRSVLSSSANSFKKDMDKLGDSGPQNAPSASQISEAIIRKTAENLEEGGDDQDLELALQLSWTLNFTDASLLLPPLGERDSHKSSISCKNLSLSCYW
jgi:hypothetical protein